ncbi:MAG TPA: MFS transporter [Chloroflexota bacterium]|nr:MFS transporter [Chloroflexota bacterium]
MRLLALLTLAHVVVDAYASAVPALLPFWQERFGLTYALAGLIRAISDVTSSVAQPLVGILTDRGRNPRWVAVACLLAALGVSATGLAPAFPLFLICVVSGGLGVSGFHPMGYKLVGLHSGRSQATATSWFLVGGNLGVAIGPLIGTGAVLTFGIPGTSALLIPGVLFAGAMWWLIPAWSRARERSAAEAAAERAAAAAQKEDPVRALARRRRVAGVLVLVLFVALRSTVTSALVAFVPLYYVRIAGLGEGVASQVLSGILLAGAVSTLAGGYLADRVGRMRVLAASLLPVPFLLALFVSREPGSAAGTAALWAVSALITGTFSVTVVLAQELWHERRALASGLVVGSAFGLGGLLVPLVGAVADRWGLPAAFQAIAVIPVIALGLLAALIAILAPALKRAAPAGHNLAAN